MAGKRRRLISARKAAGFSQERLAEAVGVERTTIMRWEHGETRPQPWARPKLARALGISDQSLAELLGECADPLDSPEDQALLDTALDWASNDVKTRFTRALVSGKHEQTTGLDAATAAIGPATDPIIEALHGGDVDRRRALKVIGAGATLYSHNKKFMGLREFVLNAARSSALLYSAINTPKVEDRTLDEAREDLRCLATDYVVNPELTRIVPDLITLRDRLYVLLVRYGQRPGDARELNLLLGATCVLLASASHDVGEPSAAMVQTRAALAFAEHAGHRGLITWVYCTRAMIASWWGSADEVLSHAQKARAAGLHGIGAIRLTGLEARALAQSGQHEEATGLLHAAQGQRHKLFVIDDNLGDLGEVFTFPVAREYYYNAAAHAHANDWRAVEHEASKVISLYETLKTGQRWPATMTLSRVYLAQSRLHLSGPEGAHDALLHVFNLPNGQRVHQTVQALSRIRVQLRSRIYSKSPAARDLDEAIHNFNSIADSRRRP